MMDRVYATRGLLDVLLELAADRDPGEFSAPLQVSPATDLEAEDETAVLEELDPDLPVFTDFYFPSTGRAVDAVFGVDVTVPHAQTQGRFIAHPEGLDSISIEDDLHEVVIVAVPPWCQDSIKAYDRRGRRLPITAVPGAPAAPPFEQ
jgi:hypothetical protein